MASKPLEERFSQALEALRKHERENADLHDKLRFKDDTIESLREHLRAAYDEIDELKRVVTLFQGVGFIAGDALKHVKSPRTIP